MGPKGKARTARLAAIVPLALLALAFSIGALFVQSSLVRTLTGIITGLTALIAALAATATWSSPAPERSELEVEALKEEFLRKWIMLERLMRTKLAESTNDQEYRTAPLSRILKMYSQALGYSGDKLSALLRNLDLRNNLVHASSRNISSEELSRAVSQLNGFIDSVGAERVPDLAGIIGDGDTVSPREDEAIFGLLGLGAQLNEQGDIDGARAAFQQAIDSGAPDTASLALLSLGVLLDQQGDIDGARAAFQQAIDSGGPDVASRALLSLGIVSQQQGDIDGARAAYQQAIDTGDREVRDVAREFLQTVKYRYSAG